MRRRSGRLGWTAAALAAMAVVALGWWWAHPPDPAAELRAHARPLASLERVPAPELGRGFERWCMIAPGADTVTGLWRPAAPPGARPETAGAPGPQGGGAPSAAAAGEPPAPAWAVIVLGGIGTDERAALLVPDSLPVSVLAVGWPWRGPRRMGRLEFIANLPALRAALLRTPGAVARGVAAVRRVSPGTRVVLVGASLGVPPTVAALALTRPDGLVLVDGAADLGRLLRSESASALGGGVTGATLAPLAAALGARLLSALEPGRHGGAARGIPTLLVDAERDERYPRECVARLHAAFPRATRATHPGGHMRTEDRGGVQAIVGQAWAWLQGSAGRESGAR